LKDDIRIDCLLFGETQSRVIISCSTDDVTKIQELFNRVDISCNQIGTVGGDKFKINDLIDLPLGDLSHSFFDAMPEFMERLK